MAKKDPKRVAEDEDPCTLTQYSRPVVDVAQCEELLDILAFAYYSSELFHKARAAYEKLTESLDQSGRFAPRARSRLRKMAAARAPGSAE